MSMTSVSDHFTFTFQSTDTKTTTTFLLNNPLSGNLTGKKEKTGQGSGKPLLNQIQDQTDVVFNSNL